MGSRISPNLWVSQIYSNSWVSQIHPPQFMGVPNLLPPQIYGCPKFITLPNSLLPIYGCPKFILQVGYNYVMDTMTDARRCPGAVQCMAVVPAWHVPDLLEDARAGLLEPPRSLPPKYFYDARGAVLFDRICDTPEYYPTRTEDALLRQYGDEIIALTRPDYLIELGSGNSKKTTNLFDACEQQGHTCVYAPFDICEPVLTEAAGKLQADYQWLNVRPLLGDYHAGLANMPHFPGARLFMFLGGTIGNFTPPEVRAFIGDMRRRMSAGRFSAAGGGPDKRQ